MSKIPSYLGTFTVLDNGIKIIDDDNNTDSDIYDAIPGTWKIWGVKIKDKYDTIILLSQESRASTVYIDSGITWDSQSYLNFRNNIAEFRFYLKAVKMELNTNSCELYTFSSLGKTQGIKLVCIDEKDD